ncbi:TIGR03943 family putative permease subunit [Rossellomorea vietnamensis]|uniref:TIGR03943 family putative permease subunit n=1 Tax=Rossellomorea vietnamensis TaxID=218284 RepID=UPI00077CCF33|nr:TIGR03943 family protein [Rossellomorea vietnamensis]PRX75933.1 putative membrane protein [Bacillus sp. V-88]SLK23299.1 putative membrane protein [Bacillus sp. V-88]
MNSSVRFHTYIRGIILLGYALLLLKLFLTFNLQYFIAPRMNGYLYFALGIFLLLGAIQVIRGTSSNAKTHSCDCEGHELPRGAMKSFMIYTLFVLPLVLGFLMPDNVLDSAAAAKRGVKIGNTMFSTPPAIDGQSKNTGELNQHSTHGLQPKLDSYDDFPVEEDFEKLKDIVGSKEKIIVRDEQYIQTLSIVDEELKQHVGKEVQLTGFIYKDESFSGNQAVISRYVVSCCVADASVYGLLVQDTNMANLEPDTWVNVSGILDAVDFNGRKMPVITHPVFEEVEQPENPYVEEFYIKIE